MDDTNGRAAPAGRRAECSDRQEAESARKLTLPQNGTTPPPALGCDGHPSPHTRVAVSKHFSEALNRSRSSPSLCSDVLVGRIVSPIKLGCRNAWLENEIDDFIAGRISASDVEIV